LSYSAENYPYNIEKVNKVVNEVLGSFPNYAYKAVKGVRYWAITMTGQGAVEYELTAVGNNETRVEIKGSTVANPRPDPSFITQVQNTIDDKIQKLDMGKYIEGCKDRCNDLLKKEQLRQGLTLDECVKNLCK
jgi:hypothetical protein